MPGPDRERWEELCALAAKEEDNEKLLKLVQEINQLLEAKECRLHGTLSKSESNGSA
jgi:hypothetical protein